MNLKRGLFRLWLALSVPWIAWWSWYADLPCTLGLDPTGKKPWCLTGLYIPVKPPVELAALVAGTPLALGLILLSILWIARGFSPD